MGAVAKLEFKVPGTPNNYFYSEETNYKALRKMVEEFINIPDNDKESRISFIKKNSEDFMKISLGYSLVPIVIIYFDKEGRSESEVDQWEGLFNDIRNQLLIMDDKDLFNRFLSLKEKYQEESKELARATRDLLFALFLIGMESHLIQGRLTSNHFQILDELISEVEDLFDEIMLHDYYNKIGAVVDKYISKTSGY